MRIHDNSKVSNENRGAVSGMLATAKRGGERDIYVSKHRSHNVLHYIPGLGKERKGRLRANCKNDSVCWMRCCKLVCLLAGNYGICCTNYLDSSLMERVMVLFSFFSGYDFHTRKRVS